MRLFQRVSVSLLTLSCVFCAAPTPTQAADGESAHTSFIVYDSLGTPITIGMSFVLESRTTGSSTWRFYASAELDSDVQFDVGTGAFKPGEDDHVVRADLPPPDVEAANLRPPARQRDAAAEAKRGQSLPDSDSDKVVTLDAFRKIDDRRKT